MAPPPPLLRLLQRRWSNPLPIVVHTGTRAWRPVALRPRLTANQSYLADFDDPTPLNLAVARSRLAGPLPRRISSPPSLVPILLLVGRYRATPPPSQRSIRRSAVHAFPVLTPTAPAARASSAPPRPCSSPSFTSPPRPPHARLASEPRAVLSTPPVGQRHAAPLPPAHRPPPDSSSRARLTSAGPRAGHRPYATTSPPRHTHHASSCPCCGSTRAVPPGLVAPPCSGSHRGRASSPGRLGRAGTPSPTPATHAPALALWATDC
nr:proline-rich receptor-like protein kinase PERK13 [Aegilops tauschii subsp. strangulata]